MVVALHTIVAKATVARPGRSVDMASLAVLQCNEVGVVGEADMLGIQLFLGGVREAEVLP